MLNISELCLKRYETAVLYLSFLSLGLCAAIPGPTLLDLSNIVKSDIGHIAYIYLGRSSGYLLGSFLGGLLLNYVQRKKLLMLFFNLIMTFGVFGTPWCRDVYTLVGVMAVSGIAMGALDTGGNVWCLYLWGEDSSPYFQALHFLFGLGAFIAPLIAEPFLVLKEEDVYSLYNMSSSMGNEYNSQNVSFFQSLPQITYVYGIIGIFSLFVSFLFLVLLCVSVKQHRKEKVEITPNNENNQNTIISVIVVFLSSLLLCVYAGIEIGYGQMIATFAVKSNLHLTKATASLITSVYWGTFTFSRGISIALAAKFSPLSLLLTDLGLMLLASTILVLFGNMYVDFLWIGTAILGVSLASFYPSTITWIEKHLNVCHKVASAFVVAASLGEMIVPLSISQFVNIYPKILFYIVICCVFVCGILLFILWLILRKIGNKYFVNQTVPVQSHENESINLKTQDDIDENSL